MRAVKNSPWKPPHANCAIDSSRMSRGNATWERFIAFAWEGGGQRLLVAVNNGPDQGPCYVRLPWTDLEGRVPVLQDLMHPAVRYERAGGDLARRGLYLDVPGWRYHVFALADRD